MSGGQEPGLTSSILLLPRLQALALLVDHQADVGYRDEATGQTPSHLAAYAGHCVVR